ncbi:restriction endonuclease [Candidatus Woesearchaeota archaeon]|nr:restriction endonuclease [Candidatus Woesearchaeota archaeon]
MDAKILQKIKDTIISELTNFEWKILGVIDDDNNVYPMTSDTKVLSKIFEMVAIPHFKKIVKKLSIKDNPCQIVLAEQQNQYPDISLTGGILGNNKIAIDIKSAYRTEENKFSGFTLGAFNGYFKNRLSTKNIKYAYSEYAEHWVLCFIYDRDLETDITGICKLDKKEDIPIIIKNVEIILQDKWKVSVARPGSGNTANIGGINDLDKLKRGEGDFHNERKKIFDDYWMHYIRKEDCPKISVSSQPYKNLAEYKQWVKDGRKDEDKIKKRYSVCNK